MSEGGIPGTDGEMFGGHGMGSMREQSSDAADEETADGKKAFREYGSETWILLGASMAVMLLGLLFAGLYRRR